MADNWQEPLQFSDEVERLLAEDDDFKGLYEEEDSGFENQVAENNKTRPAVPSSERKPCTLAGMPTLNEDAPRLPSWQRSAHLFAAAEMKVATDTILFETNNSASKEAAKILAKDKIKDSVSERDLSDLLTPAKSYYRGISNRTMVRRRPGTGISQDDAESVVNTATTKTDKRTTKNKPKPAPEPDAIALNTKTRWNSNDCRFSAERMDKLACTKKGDWSEEEDALLVEKHKECDGCWQEIARFFKGKSDVDVCDRWRKFMSPEAKRQLAQRERQRVIDKERRLRQEQSIMSKVEAKKLEVAELKDKQERSEWEKKCIAVAFQSLIDDSVDY